MAVNRRAACEFFIGNRIKYNRECAAEALGSDSGQRAENLHGSYVKRAIWADLTGRSPLSTLPLTDLQYFLKRGE
jgi:hypothetical protein